MVGILGSVPVISVHLAPELSVLNTLLLSKPPTVTHILFSSVEEIAIDVTEPAPTGNGKVFHVFPASFVIYEIASFKAMITLSFAFVTAILRIVEEALAKEDIFCQLPLAP